MFHCDSINGCRWDAAAAASAAVGVFISHRLLVVDKVYNTVQRGYSMLSQFVVSGHIVDIVHNVSRCS